MAIMLWQAVKHLRESGLLTSAEVKSHQLKFLARQPEGDAKGFLRELVRLAILTPYQAVAIYQAKPHGLVFDKYVVLDKIASGGMGMVFKARHRLMNRIVALKILSQSAIQSPAAVERFHREVQAAARLMHPNIVTAHDAGQDKGIPFLVLEYVSGSDLANYVRDRGRLPVGQAVDFILQAASGLEHVHRQGVIHRDIKPSNLLVNDSGSVKVLDMGLARFASSLSDLGPPGNSLTEFGSMMGTVDYMSPEQAANAMQADQRADIYSLGCTLHYLLTGRSTYPGDTLMERLAAHREHTIPDLCAIRADVPQRLQTVFARMVAKKPEDRYQAAGDVIDELAPLVIPKDQWTSAPGTDEVVLDADTDRTEALRSKSVDITQNSDRFRTVASPPPRSDAYPTLPPTIDPPHRH